MRGGIPYSKSIYPLEACAVHILLDLQSALSSLSRPPLFHESPQTLLFGCRLLRFSRNLIKYWFIRYLSTAPERNMQLWSCGLVPCRLRYRSDLAWRPAVQCSTRRTFTFFAQRMGGRADKDACRKKQRAARSIYQSDIRVASGRTSRKGRFGGHARRLFASLKTSARHCL